MSKFKVGDKVLYSESPGVWEIEKILSPGVYRIIRASAVFCDMVPEHMLTGVIN